MQQYDAIAGQSLIDVCLNTYGSLENLTQLALDNSVQSINDAVLSGQTFYWNIPSDIQQPLPIYSTKNNLYFDQILFVLQDDQGNLLTDDSENYIS